MIFLPRLTNTTGFMLFCLVLGAATLSGCGGKTGTGGVAIEQPRQLLWPSENDLTTDRPGCDILAGEALPGGEFTFVVTDQVDPQRAPVPHNPSERLIFAQLYETLVKVDCDGTVGPGLAQHWTCTEDSTVWVFTLREDARFWDGTRVTPGEVKEAWTLNQDCPRTRSVASPWSWFNARARTITILDARRLAIRLPEPQASFPLLLSHPATAIALPQPGWTWPVGSGPCRLRATTPVPLPHLECRPNQHHPDQPIWKSLTFTVQPGSDPRDLAGLEADLMMVRRLDNLRYFKEAPGFSTHPLPWDRLYLLVVSPEQNPLDGQVWTEAADRLNPRRDLTTISARGWPEIIFPAGTPVDCPQLSGPVAMGGSARRSWDLGSMHLDGDALVYQADDPGATEIATRLVALSGEPLRIVALPNDAATFVLDWQMAGAQIIRLDQVFSTRCLQAATLLGKAAWIQKAGLGLGTDNPLDPQAAQGDGNPGANSLVDAESRFRPIPQDPLTPLREFIHPLALSRPWLIARGNLAGLRLAYDGTPMLSGLGSGVTGENLP